MENGLGNEKPSPARDPQRMFTTDAAIKLASKHLKKTRIIQALLILVAVPVAYVLWVVAQRQADLDVIFTARAAMLTCLPFVAAAIFSPLFLRYPKEVRWRGFVMQWFIIAVFFNIIWQVPALVLKSSVFDPLCSNGVCQGTEAHLPYFAIWWGYHSADLDYGYMTRFWILAEVSFWIVSILAVVGLVKLWRGNEKQAFTLFGVCGALQLYNVLFFMGNGGIVGFESNGKIFDNVATDSPLAPILYWTFNSLWGIAGLVASVLSFKCLFYMNRKRSKSGAQHDKCDEPEAEVVGVQGD
jgi:hypothetical protein